MNRTLAHSKRLTGILASVIGAALLTVAHANNQQVLNLPDAVITGIEPREDGTDVFFHVPPGFLYAVYVSTDGKNWDDAEMGAEIAPGLFHVHDEGAVGQRKRFYRVAVFHQACWSLGNNYVQWRVDQTPLVEELTPGQRAALTAAITNYANAVEAWKDRNNQLWDYQRQLADCLKEVSRLRLEWLAAQQATMDARKAQQDAERSVSSTESWIGERITDQETAASRRDQWFHELTVFLDWAADYDAAGDPVRAAEMRANAANAQSNYEDWSTEADRIAQDIVDAQADLAAQRAAVTAAQAAVGVAEAAEQAAREAYENAKRDCEPLKGAVEGATEAVERAKAEAAAAHAEMRTADETAKEQAKDNKAQADAAAEAAAAAAGDPPPPVPAAPLPTVRQREIAKFLQHLKEHGGLDAWESAMNTFYGAALSSGLVTLEGLGSLMEAWANGLRAPGSFAQGFANGGLQMGWGIIVTWVQGTAEDFAKRLATRTIAKLAVLEVPNRGDVKFVENKNGSAQLYIRNDDMTVTVMVYTPSQGLNTGTYKIP